MTITKEQADQIKQQLLVQIDKLPQENKEQIKKQVQELNEEELEGFLKQNKIKVPGITDDVEDEESKSGENKEQKCIFCSITKNEISSHKIGENNKSIAILEINPLSKGHSIILPIDHVSTEKLPKQSMTLAQKIAKKIKKKLKPEDVKIETSSLMNHAMINVIPLYKDIPIKKTKASEEELLKLQKKLETKKRTPRKKSIQKTEIEVEDISKLPKINFRIP